MISQLKNEVSIEKNQNLQELAKEEVNQIYNQKNLHLQHLHLTFTILKCSLPEI